MFLDAVVTLDGYVHVSGLLDPVTGDLLIQALEAARRAGITADAETDTDAEPNPGAAPDADTDTGTDPGTDPGTGSGNPLLRRPELAPDGPSGASSGRLSSGVTGGGVTDGGVTDGGVTGDGVDDGGSGEPAPEDPHADPAAAGRSISERNPEALRRLLDLATAATGPDGLPIINGSRPRISVHIDAEDLIGPDTSPHPHPHLGSDPAGRSTTSPPTPPPPPGAPGMGLLHRFGVPTAAITATQTQILACDATLAPLVVDRSGQIIAILPGHPHHRAGVAHRDPGPRRTLPLPQLLRTHRRGAPHPVLLPRRPHNAGQPRRPVLLPPSAHPPEWLADHRRP